MNLTDFAHSKTRDAILKAVSIIKRDYTSKKKRVVLEIPPGIYTLTEPLILDKYISLEGDASGGTVLQVKVQNMEGIILENNRSETDINSGYNTIRNLTITGPDFGKNPFEWKDTSKYNIRSIGIKIQGLRNRIENCTIDGFLWSGILVSGSYYNYISDNFIKNNRIGITLENTSTSAFIRGNELRMNGAGLLIDQSSYANFISNNMIENNLGNMLNEPNSKDTTVSAGNGLIIKNSTNNFVQNNYFEQHYNNIVLHNAENNHISSNFFGVTQLENKTQNILKLSGKTTHNLIENNTTMGATSETDSLRIILQGNNFSSNVIDFGREKNEILKSKFRKNQNPEQAPKVP